MADANGRAPTGNDSAGNSDTGTIAGSNGPVRVDPGAIDDAHGANAPGSTPRPGYGPNGRKLKRDGTERAARNSTGGNASPRPAQGATLPVDALAGTIVGFHALLSATLKVKELALDPEEGKTLAQALANLQRFYPVHVTEKALAWGNLFSAVGMIYGTRIGAIMANSAANKRATPRPDNVVRPREFQQPRPSVVVPQAPVADPNGDPVEPAPNAPRPAANAGTGENIFSSTPPEYM